jgi:hypothetical protein
VDVLDPLDVRGRCIRLTGNGPRHHVAMADKVYLRNPDTKRVAVFTPRAAAMWRDRKGWDELPADKGREALDKQATEDAEAADKVTAAAAAPKPAARRQTTDPEG